VSGTSVPDGYDVDSEEQQPMAQSAGLHEPEGRLSPQTIDRHRALTSIQEELEAVDWYDQRVDATTDHELAAVLAHNRDEEKEHAAMTLEWLRRHDPVLDRALRAYLFTSEPVTEVEQEREAGGDTGGEMGGGLGIGSLRGATL
jgi:ferritin-like protein